MSKRHKIFVSYHHALDEYYKTLFEHFFGEISDVLIPGSVQIGDIDPQLPTDTIRSKIRDEYLRDTSVTVVLVGSETWKRKHIDWEIGSSLRQTTYNPRSGLLGILLPTYSRPTPNTYNEYTIPPRLYDNVECGFATIHPWSNNSTLVQDWIHEAYLRKGKITPDNSRDSFSKNRSGNSWKP